MPLGISRRQENADGRGYVLDTARGHYSTGQTLGRKGLTMSKNRTLLSAFQA